MLRRRFPAAVGYVEAAARTGEEGGLVRSRLGRTCPPPSAAWLAAIEPAGGPEPDPEAAPRGRRAARDRGRFTRNFVVQASAADWALVLLAACAAAWPARPASWCSSSTTRWSSTARRDDADRVAAEVRDAAAESGRLVFGDTAVRFPLSVAVVDCYADAK